MKHLVVLVQTKNMLHFATKIMKFLLSGQYLRSSTEFQARMGQKLKVKISLTWFKNNPIPPSRPFLEKSVFEVSDFGIFLQKKRFLYGNKTLFV